jgi:glycosyltransferase involved in cell wall biosynthesis
MKTSVIIPAFNAAGTLAATIRSCLDQTPRPCEVIVVDDGSTDATREVARGFSGDVRLETVSNGGVARARNTGAAVASGEALVFLDADDVLLPHALGSLAATLEASGSGMAYGMVIERAEPPGHARLNGFAFAEGRPPVPAERNFWRCAVITPGSAIVRAGLHRRVGGFVSGYEPLEDRDYWVKCGLLEAAAFCDTVVLDKTWRPSSHGSQHAKRIFRGQRAQRDLRGWCAERGIDAAWIPGDREILRRAIDEALWRRDFGILPPLLAAARKCGLRHWKGLLTSLLVKAETPAWVDIKPKPDF